MILSSVVVHLVKAAYPSLRPAELLQSVHVVGPLLRSGSFPSGHAAASMSAGLAIAHFCSSRATSAVVMAIALLIALSRIFVGAHFPADVLGGMICALGVFLIFRLTAWPTLEAHVPEHPSLSRRRFRVALCFEVLAVLFAALRACPAQCGTSLIRSARCSCGSSFPRHWISKVESRAGLRPAAVPCAPSQQELHVLSYCKSSSGTEDTDSVRTVSYQFPFLV